MTKSVRYGKSPLSAALSTVLITTLSIGFTSAAIAADDEQEIEEIVVVGSQIKGANISGALSVSVLNAEEIEALGIDSGEQLLEYMPENGMNLFNEAENISGGVNAARGDVGAFNLRDMGTGNTLVLLNGRRLLNSPGFQTEEIGGSFVPVNTVNSNLIPVYGVQRVEVLREGASAIYGADAVAGVVNTVLKNDFEGFTFRIKHNNYDNFDRRANTITFEYGKDIGNGNLGVFFNFYERDRIRASEDPRMRDGDLRPYVVGTPWEGSTSFRNTSANSLYGQFDAISSISSYGIRNVVTDSSGEFEVYPAGDARCAIELNFGTCLAPDGQGTEHYNLNENRDVSSEMERLSLFVYWNQELDNGVEAFTEALYYQADSNLNRHPSASFSTVKLVVDAENYYNPLGPCGSPNRIPEDILGTDVPCSGVDLLVDNYRFAELPRIVDNESDTWRFLQGFRGEVGAWSWDTAISWARATKDDVTHNRVSNILMQEALNDTTAAAYNPFSGGANSNIERALIDVYRKGESELMTFDVKFSNPAIIDLPAGPVGFLAGFELRKESFDDDRDPRLDGTIVFTDRDGDTYPLVSDVVNSSPTPDNDGDRRVTSLFFEADIPLHETLDLQLAMRYEDFDDIDKSTTVGKVAFGWRPIDMLLVRGSWSEAFRAPNLVTVNESIVARQNTRTDWACTFAADNGGDPDQDTIDCRNSTQRIAQGSDDLQAEESTNTSFGLVFEPIENLTITLDYWTIEKDDTIGLFGEENHTLLDLFLRLENGTTNCAGFGGNTVVNRTVPDEDASAIYLAAGICPAGDIRFIEDQYANLDTRVVEGHDIGIYYDFDTPIGNFDIRYVATALDKYNQEPGGQAATLIAAQSAGLIPSNYPVAGFDDLVEKNGNPEDRSVFTLTWKKDNMRGSLSARTVGEFYQDSLTLADGTRWVVDDMTTYNVNFDYSTEIADVNTRFRLGINNFTDERAPLADRFFGYFADMHTNLGRYYYVDLRAKL
jgi:iron complex outermembrane recepter protein